MIEFQKAYTLEDTTPSLATFKLRQSILELAGFRVKTTDLDQTREIIIY